MSIHKLEVKASILLDRISIEPETNRLQSDYDNLDIIIEAEKNIKN